MSISIIIPTLNEAACIGQQLQYLWAHGSPALLEILVVDGGSRDETAQVAEAAGAKILHSNIQSRAAQMNLGARAAQGKVLYFVHADTRPPETFAEDIALAMAAGYGMGCYRYRFDSPRFLLKINAFFNRYNWLWCQGGDKTFFIDARLFAEAGGYDEYYTIMEEYDFLRRNMPKYPMITLPKYAVTSARKYANNSWLRVQFANALVFNLWKWGLAPARLKKIYRRLIKP